jgi:hypothetical protein
MREEAVFALRLGLELFEHVRELEDLLQPGSVEQHPVVGVEEGDATAIVVVQRVDRLGVDAPLPCAALDRRRYAGLTHRRPR